MASSRLPRRLVPVAVVLGLGYLNYASGYVVGYRNYWKHGPDQAAVALWVLMGILQSVLFTYWMLLYMKGPGRCAPIKPFDIFNSGDSSYSPVPPIFLCDALGFPYWCSTCNTIKAPRAVHSSDMGRCVPKFDHFCYLIGTVIGRSNYVYFIRFVQMFLMLLTLVVAFTAASARAAFRRPGNFGHYVVILVLALLWSIMTVSLFGMQYFYIKRNWTTIDELNARAARVYERYQRRQLTPREKWYFNKLPRKEDGVRYVNIAHQGSRAVVPFHVDSTPYSFGFRRNLVAVMLEGNRSLSTAFLNGKFVVAMVMMVVPFSEFFLSAKISTADHDDFGPDFREDIDLKLAKSQYTTPTYLKPERSESEETEAET